MKSRERLVENNELFGRLVAADNREEPRPEVLEALLRKLPASASTARAAVRARGWQPQRWMPIAALAGCLVASVFAFEQASNAPGEVALSTSVAAPHVEATDQVGPAEQGTPAELTEQGVIPTARIDDLPAAVATSKRPTAQRANPAPGEPREIELIIKAREALTRLEIDRCLAAVAAYEAAYPKGQFVLEAKIMRIEAVAARGDSAQARALARDFLAKNPSSLYEDRVRSLLTSLEER